MTLIGVILSLGALTYAGKDPWWAEDKAKHMATAYILTKYALHSGLKREHSIVIVLSLSVGKEIYDRKVKKTLFSVKDLLYDIIGIGLGILL